MASIIMDIGFCSLQAFLLGVRNLRWIDDPLEYRKGEHRNRVWDSFNILLVMGTTESIPTAYSRVIFTVFLLMGFLLI